MSADPGELCGGDGVGNTSAGDCEDIDNVAAGCVSNGDGVDDVGAGMAVSRGESGAAGEEPDSVTPTLEGLRYD